MLVKQQLWRRRCYYVVIPHQSERCIPWIADFLQLNADLCSPLPPDWILFLGLHRHRTWHCSLDQGLLNHFHLTSVIHTAYMPIIYNISCSIIMKWSEMVIQSDYQACDAELYKQTWLHMTDNQMGFPSRRTITTVNRKDPVTESLHLVGTALQCAGNVMRLMLSITIWAQAQIKREMSSYSGLVKHLNYSMCSIMWLVFYSQT